MILPENDDGNGGGGGGVEIPVREDIRVEMSVWEKRKENKKKGWPAKWWSGSVRWVVGSEWVGGARVVPKISTLHIFFFLTDWDVTVSAIPVG